MSEYVTIGKRYTLVIPKKIRERLRLKEGQKVLIRVEGNRVIIETCPDEPFSVLREIVKGSYSEEEEEKKAEEWLKKYANR